VKVRYREGYDLQLESPVQARTAILGHQGGNLFVGIAPDGVLTMAAGYAWDGPTGVPIKLRSMVRAALLHDAGYQLLRDGVLPPERRLAVDLLFRDTMRADGAWPVTAWAAFTAVRVLGGRFADPSSRKPILEAP
jgi:hypothetical protein